MFPSWKTVVWLTWRGSRWEWSPCLASESELVDGGGGGTAGASADASILLKLTHSPPVVAPEWAFLAPREMACTHWSKYVKAGGGCGGWNEMGCLLSRQSAV